MERFLKNITARISRMLILAQLNSQAGEPEFTQGHLAPEVGGCTGEERQGRLTGMNDTMRAGSE